MNSFGLGGLVAVAVGLMAACGGDDTAASTTGAGGGTTAATSSASSGGGDGGAGTTTASTTTTTTSTSDSSTGAGGSLPGTACFGNVTWPGPVAATVKIHFTAFEFLTAMAVQQFTVRACARGDSPCTVPVAEGPAVNGGVDLILPTPVDGFDGYFEVTGPQLATSLAHVVRPLVTDGNVTANVFAQQSLDLMVQAVGGAADPTRGHIGHGTNTCLGGTLAGAVVTVDPIDAGTSIRYFTGQVPDPALTSTSDNGLVGIANVIPGAAVQLTATYEPTDQLFATLPLVVRPAAISTMLLEPTPLP